MTAPVLVLDEVAVVVGRVPVLLGVSLEVPEGGAVGLVGETGSGKSMTARAATGLLPRIGGRIVGGSLRVAGEEMAAAPDGAWRRHRGATVALVPQSSMSSLDPVMPVGRQLEESVRLAGTRRGVRDEAVRLLRLVRLDGGNRMLASYPHELSGGMRQRVMIALALARRPRLLIADEPTTALDASVRADVLDLLTELRLQEGLSMLLISHDFGAIEAATERVVVMYAGRTVETGPTPAVMAAPAHPYTTALVASRPELTPPGRRIPAIPGHPPAPDAHHVGCAFADRCVRRLERCRHGAPELVPVAADRSTACFAATAEAWR
jgi:oligopeptide/dipeptide ABC transporter ATP-binding protein